jgi:hypothetical protein
MRLPTPPKELIAMPATHRPNGKGVSVSLGLWLNLVHESMEGAQKWICFGRLR